LYISFLQPILQRLLQKAEDVLSGGASPPHDDIFAPSAKDDKKDEFQIFSGQTHSFKANIPPSQLRGTRQQQAISQASSSSSISSEQHQHQHQQGSSKHGPYPEMHPMLVDQLNEFEGHLNAQIHTAYENESQHVNPYIPIASSGYHDPFGQASQAHPGSSSAVQYYDSQSQPPPQPQQPLTQYSHPPNPSRVSYQEPGSVYSQAPYDGYSYPGTVAPQLEYPQAVQNQHWAPDHHYPSSESFSQSETPNYTTYNNPQHIPAAMPQAAADHQQQHSLQNTWSSFVYTVGSPPPFAMD